MSELKAMLSDMQRDRDACNFVGDEADTIRLNAESRQHCDPNCNASRQARERELTEMVGETVGPRSVLQMSLAKRKLTARHIPVNLCAGSVFLPNFSGWAVGCFSNYRFSQQPSRSLNPE